MVLADNGLLLNLDYTGFLGSTNLVAFTVFYLTGFLSFTASWISLVSWILLVFCILFVFWFSVFYWFYSILIVINLIVEGEFFWISLL